MLLVIWPQTEIEDLGCNNTEELSTNLVVGFGLCAACNDFSDLIEEAFICPRIVGEAIKKIIPRLINHSGSIDTFGQLLKWSLMQSTRDKK
jgi:hypothetical protein